MKKFIILFLIILLAQPMSFAFGTKKTMEKIMNSWQGENINSVIDVWGYPSSEKEIAENHEKWTQTEILKRGISLFVFLLKKIEYTGELADINEIVLPLHLLKTK